MSLIHTATQRESRLRQSQQQQGCKDDEGITKQIGAWHSTS